MQKVKSCCKKYRKCNSQQGCFRDHNSCTLYIQWNMIYRLTWHKAINTTKQRKYVIITRKHCLQQWCDWWCWGNYSMLCCPAHMSICMILFICEANLLASAVAKSSTCKCARTHTDTHTYIYVYIYNPMVFLSCSDTSSGCFSAIVVYNNNLCIARS